MPEKVFHKNQLSKLDELDELMTNNTVILEDFNLDSNKENSETQAKKSFLMMMMDIKTRNLMSERIFY